MPEAEVEVLQRPFGAESRAEMLQQYFGSAAR